EEFPLPKEVPTASEESSPRLKRRDATAENIALLLKTGARVRLLEDREGGGIAHSREDAPIKGRSVDEGEAAAVERRVSVSISLVTEIPVAEVPTGSGSIPIASPPGTGVPTDSGMVPTAKEGERFKRKGLRLEQESAKKVKITKEEPEEKLKEMMQLILVEEHFDREDLNQLWALVKETLNIIPTANDKEKELWVELKRLYEPDAEEQLWTQEMFMLVEKDYPLRKGLAIIMISYKL
nr:hypothetical protein [Tanacetum cinerariifolium]